MSDALIAILSGTAGAALIKLVDGIIQFRLQRKAKQEDTNNENNNKLHDDIDALKGCMMIIMFEHIRGFCEDYMKLGYMDIDARRRLTIMHEKYKNIGGNGDGSRLVHEAFELPFSIDHHKEECQHIILKDSNESDSN